MKRSKGERKRERACIQLMSLCLFTSCLVEADGVRNKVLMVEEEVVVEEVRKEEAKEEERVLVEAAEEMTTLLMSLKEMYEEEEEEEEESVVDLNDFVIFVHGWCMALSLRPSSILSEQSIRILSLLSDLLLASKRANNTNTKSSSSNNSSNHNSKHDIVVESLRDDLYELEVAANSKRTMLFLSTDSHMTTTDSERSATTAVLQRLVSVSDTTTASAEKGSSSSSTVIERDAKSLLSQIEAKEKEEEEGARRNVSHQHYVLSQCLDAIGRPVSASLHANAAKNLRKAWGLSQTDLALAGAVPLGVEVPSDEDEEVMENPLRPIVRMDQWCLVRDFFLSCQHMASASERLGQPHRASYWLDQGKEFASRLGLTSLCLKYSLDCVRLERRRGGSENEKRSERGGSGGSGGVKNLEHLFAAMDVDEDNLMEIVEEHGKLSGALDVTKARDQLRQMFMSEKEEGEEDMEIDSCSSFSSSSFGRAAASLRSVGWSYEIEERTRRSKSEREKDDKDDNKDDDHSERIDFSTSATPETSIEMVHQSLQNIPLEVTLVSLSMSDGGRIFATRASGKRGRRGRKGRKGERKRSGKNEAAAGMKMVGGGFVLQCETEASTVSSVLSEFNSVIQSSDDRCVVLVVFLLSSVFFLLLSSFLCLF